MAALARSMNGLGTENIGWPDGGGTAPSLPNNSPSSPRTCHTTLIGGTPAITSSRAASRQPSKSSGWSSVILSGSICGPSGNNTPDRPLSPRRGSNRSALLPARPLASLMGSRTRGRELRRSSREQLHLVLLGLDPALQVRLVGQQRRPPVAGHDEWPDLGHADRQPRDIVEREACGNRRELRIRPTALVPSPGTRSSCSLLALGSHRPGNSRET